MLAWTRLARQEVRHLGRAVLVLAWRVRFAAAIVARRRTLAMRLLARWRRGVTATCLVMRLRLLLVTMGAVLGSARLLAR